MELQNNIKMVQGGRERGREREGRNDFLPPI